MRTLMTALVLALGVAAQAEAKARLACAPLPGADALLDKNADYILMGEAHGTASLPELTADLVCHAARTGRPLIVGVELLGETQGALDAYLASKGDAAARTALLTSVNWPVNDPRASDAIIGLIDQARWARATGAKVRLLAFDARSEQPGTSAAREAAMAQKLIAAHAAAPKARIIVQTGAGHAGKSPFTSFGPPFKSMAQHLPTDRTLSLSFVRTGGELWGCRRPQPEAAEECRVWPATVIEPMQPRSAWLPTTREGFDAQVSTGAPLRPSPPAKP